VDEMRPTISKERNAKAKRTTQMPKKYQSEQKVTLDFWTVMKASVLKKPKQTLSDYIRLLIDKAHDEQNEEGRKRILGNRAAQCFRGS
jgi:macrodomain Ter protein organizer (MatP/YcbG family)